MCSTMNAHTHMHGHTLSEEGDGVTNSSEDQRMDFPMNHKVRLSEMNESDKEKKKQQLMNG